MENRKMRNSLFCWLMVVVVGMVGSVWAGDLSIGCNYPTSINVEHISGATEGYGGGDVTSIPVPTENIDFYSKVSFDPYRLKWDARPVDSFSTITTYIAGNQLVGGSKSANIDFYINDMTNFVGKYIQAKLYQRQDDGEGGYAYNLIGTYDVKSLDIAIYPSAPPIPITVLDGISDGGTFYPSHKLDIEFYLYSDFNRDRDTNLEDFNLLSKDWGKTAGQYVADISGPSGIPDGIVDIYDLREFCSEWLE